MQRFKKILLVLGESHLSSPATVRAINLARINRARLTVVDVLPGKSLGLSLPSLSDSIKRVHDDIAEQRKQELDKLFFDYSQELYITTEVLTGKAFIEIIRCVQRHSCDLVIKMVDNDKRFSSILFGSTDLQLLRKCPCPVWVVKHDDSMSGRKIVAAVQLEPYIEGDQPDQLNQQIIEIASSLAYREESSLHIVNAWIVFDGATFAKKLSKHYEKDVAVWVEEQRRSIAAAQLVFQKMVEKHLQKNKMSDLSCTFHFLEGEAEEVIADLVERQNMDLVVMGTVARTDLAGFFVGNTSEAVLNQIDSSVLAVKPAGFCSPITLEAG